MASQCEDGLSAVVARAGWLPGSPLGGWAANEPVAPGRSVERATRWKGHSVEGPLSGRAPRCKGRLADGRLGGQDGPLNEQGSSVGGRLEVDRPLGWLAGSRQSAGTAICRDYGTRLAGLCVH